MTKIKILGIGSPFGEDQVGWQVVNILKKQMFLPTDIHQYVQLICCDRPGVRLIELMQDVNIVYLIDAVKADNEIGTIHRLENQEVQEFKNMFSTHHMGVAEALQLGSVLDELPEKVILYGIEINHTELHSVISERVMRAIYQVADLLKDEIIDMLINIKGIDGNEISY